MIDTQTIFDSDEAENEYMQEIARKAEKKTIEEMARIICGNNRDCRNCGHNSAVRECGCLFYAKRIYEQGYRKQIEGEWEKVMNHKECSNCHYRAPYKKIKAGYHLQDLTAYCPNCGAKMRGV